jgi:hypothetical protein
MPSIIEICNIALSNLGAGTINALDEASQEGRQCNLRYAIARDSALRAYPWNFATKIIALATSTETIPGWTYVYAYPSDCLQARKVFSEVYNDPANPVVYRVLETATGKVIVCNISEAHLEYTAKITNPAEYDPQFIEALAWKLAMDLAVPLAGNKELREHCAGFYKESLGSAQTSDAREEKIPLPQSNSYLEARG